MSAVVDKGCDSAGVVLPLTGTAIISSTMAVLLSILSLALAVAATPLSTSHNTLQRPYPFVLAPLTTPHSSATVVKDGYIIVLKDELSTEQVFAHIESVKGHSDSLMASEGGLKHVYDLEGLKGYAGSFEQETIDLLRAQPEVEYIEKDTIVHALDTQLSAPWVSCVTPRHVSDSSLCSSGPCSCISP